MGRGPGGSQVARVPSSWPTAPEPAYLPNVGDVYLVSPRLLGSRDDRSPGDRSASEHSSPVPVVVIAVPALHAARIQVVVRSGDRLAAGISHGTAPQLGLERPGVWSNVVTVDKSMWTPANARWRGPLERVVLSEVLERFE